MSGEPAAADDELPRRHGGLQARRLAVLRAVSNGPRSTAVGDVACPTASDDSGYAVGEAEVTYRSRRPECLEANPEISHQHEREESDRRV